MGGQKSVETETHQVPLGSWRCPSGNSCDACFFRDPDGLEHVKLAWDSPPPLSVADMIWYLGHVLPAITQRLAEYVERPAPRRTLVVLTT